jgi:hypothetical protein
MQCRMCAVECGPADYVLPLLLLLWVLGQLLGAAGGRQQLDGGEGSNWRQIGDVGVELEAVVERCTISICAEAALYVLGKMCG